jgi:hypothetical protein
MKHAAQAGMLRVNSTSRKSDYVCISGVQSKNIFKTQYTLNLLPEIMESMMS